MTGGHPAQDTSRLRPAREDDVAAVEALIARSVPGLMGRDYDDAALRASIGPLFGVDRQIVDDRTYYVVDHAGAVVAAGGWSFRQTLFGGDAVGERNSARADPERDAAHIRAYYVDPDQARRGLGTLILRRSEADAAFVFELPGGIRFTLRHMTKSLASTVPDGSLRLPP